jgi:plastocyanin
VTLRWVLGVAVAFGALWLLTPSVAHAQSADVSIVDFAYQPAEVTVGLGDSVTWTNNGSSAHTVHLSTGVNSSPNCVPAAGLNCMSPGDQFTVSFDVAGRFTYHCDVHNAMSGTVIVVSGQPVPSSTTTSSTTTTTSTSTTTTTTLQSAVSQSTPPTFTQSSEAALPKAIARDQRIDDDLRPWVILDVAIAGTTVITGVVLVRKGRVPFG